MARLTMPRPTMPRLATPRSLAPLRHRGFRRLAAGQLASNIGDAFYAIALPWYVLAEHGGPLLLGTVLVAYGVPRTVLLAAGGHASDRWRPWTVMMSTDTVRAVAAAALAVAAALGPARAVVLVPIAALLGASAGLFLPGSYAIVPALLPDEDLQAGNALLSGGTQLALLAGPAIGGVMVALFGPTPAFAFDAASFVISAVTLNGVRAAMRPAATPASVAAPAPVPATVGSLAGSEAAGGYTAGNGQDASAGRPTVLTLLRSARILQISLLVTVAGNLGSAGVDEVALPSLAHGPLHAGAGGYGALIAAFGGGALAGTIAAGQLRRGRRPAVTGSIAFLAQALFLAVVPYLGGTILAGAVLAAVGVLNGFGNVVMITLFQRWAPPELLGRLTGLLLTASYGVFPVSVALAALVVHGLGAAVFFPLAAAPLALAVLAGLSQRIWRDFGIAPKPATAARGSHVPRPAAGQPSWPVAGDGRPVTAGGAS
jgi:predicted MFS family arabinose efflux permease